MKKAVILLFLISLFIFSITSVPAEGELRQGSEKLVELIKDITEPLFGALFGGFSNENLFESILFFFIIIAFVYVSLERIEVFSKKPAVIWTITIAVALLATRFTTESQWVQFVLLPYNILGVALLSVIPFVIFLLFIESFDSGAIRKWGWSFWIITYIGMWYTQFDKLGQIAYIYLFAGILGLIMILSDKYIRGMLIRGYIKRGLTTKIVEQIADLQKKIDKNIERLDKTPVAQRKYLNEQIDKDIALQKKLSRIP